MIHSDRFLLFRSAMIVHTLCALCFAVLIVAVLPNEAQAQRRKSRLNKNSKQQDSGPPAIEVGAQETGNTIGALLQPYEFAVKKKKLPRQRVEVAYIDEGNNNANTIVFIHGLNGYMPVWTKQIKELSKTHRCIAIDLPGYGRSSKNVNTKGQAPIGIVFYGDVVIKLLEALNVNRATFVGHSMGGQVALNLAMRYASRVKRIVLISSTGIEQFTEKEKQLFHENMTENTIKSKTAEQLQLDFKKLFFQPPPGSEFLLKDRLAVRTASDYDGFCEIAAQSLLGVIDQPTFDLLDGVQQNVLLIYGANDAYIPHPFYHVGQKTAEIGELGRLRIRHCKLLMIPKCGHLAQFEQPEAVNNAILDFVK